jgi:hypothetical protein
MGHRKSKVVLLSVSVEPPVGHIFIPSNLLSCTTVSVIPPVRFRVDAAPMLMSDFYWTRLTAAIVNFELCMDTPPSYPTR